VRLTQPEIDYYTGFFGPDPGNVATGIQTLENSRTQQYHDLHTRYGGYGDTYIEPETAQAASVDGATNEIVLSAGHTYATGDQIVYRNGGNASIALQGSGKLLDGSVYYVIDSGANRIKLATSLANANGGIAIDLADQTLLTAKGPHTLRTGFIYALTPAEESTLTSGFKVWTEEELLYSVNEGLLKAVSDTTINVEDANIIAATLTLDVQGKIGTPSGTVDIDVTALRVPPATGSMTLAGNTITLGAGAWNAAFAVGKQIFVEGSAQGNSGPRVITAVSAGQLTVNGNAFAGETASLTVSLTLTDDERVTLAAAERNDVTYLSEPGLALTVNFDAAAKTITRVSGAALSALSVGDFIQVLGTTPNATDGQQFYRIQGISGEVITLVANATEALQLAASELGAVINLAPVVLDPAMNAATGVNGIADTIALGEPHGYLTGSKVKYGDGGNPGIALEGGGTLTDDGTYYVIRVDSTTIQLATSYANAKAGTAIELADAPLVEDAGQGSHTLSSASFIKVARINLVEDVDVEVSGAVDADATGAIFLGTESTLRIERVEAGDAVTGAQARLKAGQDLLRAAGATQVIRAADLVLEAGAGTIGLAGNPVLIDLVGTGVLTARAAQDVYLRETAGNLRIGSVFADTGGAYLSATGGSIVDGVDNGFTKVKANLIVLEALSGGIGEGGDYLEIDVSVNLLPEDAGDGVDAIGTGTLTATARDTIRIAETAGNLNIRNVYSAQGDADLKADASILDAIDLSDPLDPDSAQVDAPASLPGADITAKNVILTAGALGGIGVAGNDLDIDSSYSGDGALTILDTGLNAYIIETIGALGLNTISVGPDVNGSVQTAYLTAPNPNGGSSQGRILNRAAAGVINVTSGKIWLFAEGDVGELDNRITTQADAIEGKSTTGNFMVNNTGALEIGGVIEGSFNGESVSGIVSGGEVWVSAHSPITQSENVLSEEDITIDTPLDTAGDDDWILVLAGRQLHSTGGSIYIHAGDNVTLEEGVVLRADGGRIEIVADYAKTDAAGQLADVTITGSTFTALTSVSVTATGDILVQKSTDATPVATTITAGTFISFEAGGTVTVAESTLDAEGSFIDIDVTGDIVIDGGTVLNAGTYVNLEADGDVLIDSAASITAGMHVTIDAGGSVSVTDAAEVTASGSYISIDAVGSILVDNASVLLAKTDVSLDAATGSIMVSDGSSVTAQTGAIDASAGSSVVVEAASALLARTHIELTALAGAVRIRNSADVEAETGHVAILAQTDVEVATASSVTAAAYATLTALAGRLAVSSSSTVRARNQSVTGIAGSDIDVLDGGEVEAYWDVTLTAGDDLTIDSHGAGTALVEAITGDALLRAGDDVHIARTGVVTTLDSDHAGGDRLDTLTILGDYADTDLQGTSILIEGRILGQNVVIAGAGDADLIELRQMLELTGHTRILGEGGEDVMIVDRQPTLTTRHNRPEHLLANGSNGEVRDTIDIDGGSATDAVIVNVTGGDHADYLINVRDSGLQNDGADTLTINGTGAADVFLLREHFVAYLNQTGVDGAGRPQFSGNVERINYDRTINGRLTVTGGLQDDQFYVDDNSTITTLDGGEGSDLFQIGQVFGTNPNGHDYPEGDRPDDPRVVADDVENIDLTSNSDDIELLRITRGWLSQGISYALTAFGGENGDTFNVYSNKAELRMEGEAGNDTFVIRAFIAEDDIIANGGNDDDKFEYNINAPVSINGGTGFDTVVVIGTEKSDAFLITEDGIFGAGLAVRVDGVEEALEVDGLEGDDQFFILSTRDNVVTTVIGGLGSDTFNVAGDVTADIISQDLNGRSAVVNHGATSATGSAYDKLLVDGIAVTVADPTQGKVVIDPTGGFTEAVEDRAGSIDSYLVSLVRPSGSFTATAYLTVSAGIASSADRRMPTRPAGSPELADSLLVSTDYDEATGSGTWRRATVLRFDEGNWDAAQKIWVKAASDAAIEGERKVMVSHSLWVEGDAAVVAAYDGVAIANLEVDVLDNDIGTLLVQETGGSTRVLEGVPVSGGSSAIDDTVNVRLSVAPGAEVTVSVAYDSSQVQVFRDDVLVDALTFTSGDWDQDVTLTIKAVDDSVRENAKNAYVTFGFASADAVYGEAAPVELEVRVLDDDSARVLVTESDGGTKVIKGAAGGGDDYTLRLVSAPSAPVTVNLYDGEAKVTGASTVGTSDDRLQLVNVGTALTVTVHQADNGLTGTDPASRRDTITRTDGGSWVADGFRLGTLFTLDGGTDLYKVNDIVEDRDEDGTVTSSRLVLTADAALATGSASTQIQRKAFAVIFTTDNWYQEVQVRVEGDTNFLADPARQFVRQEPFREHVVAQISGPLIIEGGVAEGKDRSLRPAVMLPTELTALPLDVDVLTDETEQADRLNVFNDSSTADDTGWMTAVELRNDLIKLGDADQTNDVRPINLSGLGMRPGADGRSTPLTVDISETQDGSETITIHGGITFDDIEITEILLGQGNDAFNIDATSTGTPGADRYLVTVVHGGGNTPVSPGVMGGDTIVVTGGGGSASPLVIHGDTSQDGSRYDSRPDDGVFTGNAQFFANAGNDTIDARGADGMVTLYGGAGNDTLWGSGFGDHIAGGSGSDHLYGEGGPDHLYGDSGFNLDFAVSKDEDSDAAIVARLLTVPTVNASANLTGDAQQALMAGRLETTAVIPAGLDVIHGGDGADILFGDHGVIGQSAGTLRLLSAGNVTRIATAEAGNGAADELYGDADNDVILGGNGGDTIETGEGRNVAIGDLGFVDYVMDDADRGDIDRIGSLDTGVGGDDAITGGADNDMVVGGAGSDTIDAGNGRNIVLGDAGVLRAGSANAAGSPWGSQSFAILTVTSDASDASGASAFADGAGDDITTGTGNDLVIGGAGGDVIRSGSGNDLVFGDQGLVQASGGALFLDTADLPALENGRIQFTAINIDVLSGSGDDIVYAGAGDDMVLGQQGSDVVYGEDGNDDLIGGHNVAGGLDAGDYVDGGTGDDVIAGDNAFVYRQAGLINPRMRVLQGTQIYGTTPASTTNGVFDPGNDALALVTGDAQLDPSGAIQRRIVLLDHVENDGLVTTDTLADTPAGRFGGDYLAGGAHRDLIFGQLGDDMIQGDGRIDGLVLTPAADGRLVQVANPVGASRSVNADGSGVGALQLVASVEGAGDGDDYIEGNGGSDVIFGNLGQDDIVGGSSTLFGLTARSQRPDDSDILFGGAGTELARNESGNIVDEGDGKHARDADTIAGDNANIYRLVGVNGQLGGGGVVATFNGFLSFNYDSPAFSGYEASLKIIPRAVELLDYTAGGVDFNPGAAAFDIGGGDEVHGESGDDTVYGMLGNDVLFGEGEDDDLIGGRGHDWASGGTGSDGLLGDDGRIVTSRNTTVGEPLSGVAGIAQLDLFISTAGKVQQAWINVKDALKKTVNLTPFNVDPDGNASFDAGEADDLLFGGLGDDFLHGGSGDDGISGAEALPEAYSLNATLDGLIRSDYERPFNPGDLLRYDPDGFDENRPDRTGRAGEFAVYDEYDPLREILLNTTWNADVTQGWLNKDGTGRQWLLNFDPAEGNPESSSTNGVVSSDGKDALFGDLGNDMLVGGSGRDNLYGGYGNDYLNADDDQSKNGGPNSGPDPHPSYEDRAFGGAGRDVLIANTGGDRLIDWAGEFNSYLVPFAPFGLGTVSRALAPQISEFLYQLSASDGADPTRANDEGSDLLRNGEPAGELGLVRQQDPDWQDQTGAPADIQPGNIPGGSRDVLRSSNFNDGQLQAFATDSGVFAVSGGGLQVEAASKGSDAASVYAIGEALPIYFELRAQVSVIKPTAGWKANAYLIFDYQSPTDFKFAGLDVAINKLVMGHRTANGWVVDQQAPVQGGVKDGKYYNLLLAVNGTTATLLVDNSVAFTHTYQARVIDGVTYGLNWGLVGLGSDNSRGRFDNVAVQVLPPQVTFQTTETFSAGAGPWFAGPVTGTWSASGGRYLGTPATAQGAAMSLMDIGVPSLNTNAWLEMSTTLSTSISAGVVFDRYSDTDFKFAALDVVNDRVVIGHYTKRSGYVIDASVARTLNPATDYQITLTLKGSTVSVALNGQFAVSTAFNGIAVDGRFGLLAREGAASFDSVTVKTNDPAFLQQATPLLAAQAPATPVAEMLAPTGLQALKDEAIRRLAYSVDPSQLAAMGDTALLITDLPGLELGAYREGMVLIDVNGAGHGWFVDATPRDDREFSGTGDTLTARAGAAAGRMDLLSVLAHELAHAAGLEHGDGLMAEALDAGARLLPSREAAARSDAQAGAGSSAQLAAMLAAQPPVIDWGDNGFARANANKIVTSGVAEWRTDFTSFLALNKSEREPNAKLRVVIPGVVEARAWDEPGEAGASTPAQAPAAKGSPAKPLLPKAITAAAARIGALFR
jgi:Ca2+-binding RTX toxin-like protein